VNICNSICKALGIETTDKWYTRARAHTHTQPVCEQEDVTVLWHQGVHTNREFTANRPDMIIRNKQEETCILTDVAVPADRNVVQKEGGKKLKYKSLCIEIQQTWNLKCKTVPVITGATGILTKGLRKNLEVIPGNIQ